MKRNQEKERYDRLAFKTLDQQFKQEAIEGLSSRVQSIAGQDRFKWQQTVEKDIQQ